MMYKKYILSLFIFLLVFFVAKTFSLNWIHTTQLEQTNTVQSGRITEQELKERIVATDPTFSRARATDFQIVNALREWVAVSVPVINTANAKDLLLQNYKGVSSSIEVPVEERFSLFLNKEAGVWCAGMAEALLDVYHLFGFESYVVNSGSVSVDEFPGATHVVTLVKITHNNNEVLVVQDPYLNRTFVDESGNPLDYFVFLEHLRNRREGAVNIEAGSATSRLVLLPATTKCDEGCEVAPNGNYFVRREIVLTDSLEESRMFLKKNSYPANALYLHSFPFSVWGRDWGSAQNIINKAREVSGTNCYYGIGCSETTTAGFSTEEVWNSLLFKIFVLRISTV